MNNKSFTLVEIAIALIIVTVLTTLSLATYEQTLQKNDDSICAYRNLPIINEALGLYYREKGALPLTLTQLTPRQIYLAHVKVMGYPPGENRLWASLRNLFGVKPAMAQALPGKYYGNTPSILKCPADKNPGVPPLYTSYTYDRTNTFNPTTNTLIENSVYAIVYDTGNYHKKGIISPTYHANGITPGGIRGRMDSTEPKKVKKAKDKDTDSTGKLGDGDLCDKKCQEKLKHAGD